MCCPIPKQPGHPAVRPYLSKTFCRKYTLFARLPLSNSSFLLDCWCQLRTPCCSIPRTANTQIQEMQIPSIVTFQTSHTACIHCTCWRQQQEFIGAVKLADKNSSHPPRVQFGYILWMVSAQKFFSKWHHFCNVVLAWCPSLGNCSQPMHNIEPSSRSKHDQVQFLSCISLIWLLEMLQTVPELSNLLVLHAPNSLSSPSELQSPSNSWIDTV